MLSKSNYGWLKQNIPYHSLKNNQSKREALIPFAQIQCRKNKSLVKVAIVSKDSASTSLNSCHLTNRRLTPYLEKNLGKLVKRLAIKKEPIISKNSTELATA